jgi:uncharacterized membrane protein
MDMVKEKEKAPQRDLERAFGGLLRIGVGTAAAVVLAGAVLFLAQEGLRPVDYGAFKGESASLRSVPGILRSAVSMEPRGIIQFGLLLLVATPVARVAFSVFAFARQRDGIYVVITLVVLAVLLFGLVGDG